MKLVLDATGRLRFSAGVFILDELRPTMNGVVASSGAWREQSEDWHWDFPNGATFTLSCSKSAGRCILRYSVRSAPVDQPLLRFGLRCNAITGARAFLRQGYFSWDGSYFVAINDSTVASPLVGYAMTQLLPVGAGSSLVLGFDRQETFQHLFTFEAVGTALTIETCWDDRRREASSVCQSENLVVFLSDQVEEGLRTWAKLLAEKSSVPPWRSAPRIRGWCSWYNLYAAISEPVILEHMRGAQATAQREKLPMEIFQIDDGFTPEMGDWLDVKPQFPRGMKPLLDDIRAAGFQPGLWIAPFMVGNRSRLFREHPDWVVRERVSGQPLAHMKFYGEFRWHKRSEEYYILDTTHPAALAYLHEVFRVWRHEWGCTYFKTDFMHFGSEYGPDKARWHEPGLTRMEIWRRTATVIREAIGDAIWLGCGCPLWASIGLVDGVRIGRDIGVEWKGNYSAQSLLRDQATRNFGNGILWQADPDCILLRSRFHSLSDREVHALAWYAGMTGGVAMTSDALDELSPERIELWRKILQLGQENCRFPMLGRALLGGSTLDPVLVQVRPAARGQQLVLVFNSTDQTVNREYSLAELGVEGTPRLLPAEPGEGVALPMLTEGQLRVTLEPHDSVLIRLGS